jgi:transcriptional regulator with XRE-family HTH domain
VNVTAIANAAAADEVDEDVQTTLTPEIAVQVVRYQTRRYRELAGKTQPQAAEVLDKSQPTIAGYESGKNVPSRGDLFALMDFYGVRDQYERLVPVRDIASKRNTTKDSQQISSLSDLGLRVGLEFFAATIEEYVPDVVLGLLQTPDYARALTEMYGEVFPAVDVEQVLNTRLVRQEVLTRGEDPAQLTAYIEEAALRKPVGGKAVLLDQLDHLLLMAKRPNISIRVVPQSVTHHPATKAGLMVLSFTDDGRVVFTEDYHAAHLYDDAGAVHTAGCLMTCLSGLALDREESAHLIGKIREEVA